MIAAPPGDVRCREQPDGRDRAAAEPLARRSERCADRPRRQWNALVRFVGGKPIDTTAFRLPEGAGLRGWQDVMAEPIERLPAVSSEDRAVYTSGKTGPPKGVPLTHRNLAFQIQSLLAADLVTSDDRILLPLPLHHVYPFTISLLTPLALGLPIVLPFTLTGPQLVRALREGAVTTIIGVPRLFRAMLAGIETRVAASGRLKSALFHWQLAVSGTLTRHWLLVHSVFRLNVQGLPHVPREGQWVLAPNHQSYLDSSILAATLDFGRLRETYWASWTGIAFGPFFRWLRRLTHVVPIDPDRAAATSLAFGAAVLRDRHNLVWYPEGGHSKMGKLMPLSPGIGMLLEHYPVPVVPVALEGTREALPPGGFVPRPGQIRIAFGSPLDPHKLERIGKGDEPHQQLSEHAGIIAATALETMLPRGHPTDKVSPLPPRSLCL